MDHINRIDGPQPERPGADQALCTRGKTKVGRVSVAGLHLPRHCERLKAAAIAHQTAVDLVELCDAWNAEYVHSHGSRVAEGLGWAPFSVAPTALANELQDLMATPEAYAQYLKGLQAKVAVRVVDDGPPYGIASVGQTNRADRLCTWCAETQTSVERCGRGVLAALF